LPSYIALSRILLWLESERVREKGLDVLA